jgi:hypothetical protein
MKTTLTKYIRNEKGNPRGVCVAIKYDDHIRYGFSLCNEEADTYDKKKGLLIATNRAMSEGLQIPDLPERRSLVLKTLMDLERHAFRYFKDISTDKIRLQK